MNTPQWKWRDGQVGLKEFYQYTREEKDNHVKFLESLPVEKLGTTDEYILRFYSQKKKNFISIQE